MNVGQPRDSDRTGKIPPPSLVTGMASVTAATIPAPPARMAALASFERVIGFGGRGRSGDVRAC